MAISLKTAGTWARVVADPSSVTIPGSPAAGDRMFLFASWKTFSITVADPSGWTLIDDFSDGSVAAGNGTGSVHNAVWYRDWQSGDGNPSLNWSAAPTEAHAVIMLWQKGASDIWAVPAAVHAAIAATDPWAATSSATITVPDGSVVMSLVGLRDDSTTIARGADDIDDDGSPAITWNGNYVESPAAHFNSTTGQDMAGDLGHRFVTTGASGVNLTSAGDPAAAETGTVTWIVQALAVDVTGTISVTEANDTVSASGTVTVTGTASATEANDTAAASGTVVVTGTQASTEADDTASATGEVTDSGVTGTQASTEADDSAAATGTVTVSGSTAVSEADDTAAASGVVQVIGSSAATEADDTASASGLVLQDVTGTSEITEQDDTASASGVVGVEEIALEPAPKYAHFRHWEPGQPLQLPKKKKKLKEFLEQQKTGSRQARRIAEEFAREQREVLARQAAAEKKHREQQAVIALLLAK